MLGPDTEGFLTLQKALQSSTVFSILPALHLIVGPGYAPRGSCTESCVLVNMWVVYLLVLPPNYRV